MSRESETAGWHTGLKPGSGKEQSGSQKMTEIHLKDGSARNKGGDSMIRRGVTEDLAAVAGIQYTFER